MMHNRFQLFEEFHETLEKEIVSRLENFFQSEFSVNESSLSFNDFHKTLHIEKKKKGAPKTGEIENYESPEYVVQPAPGDKGFFMFKKAFDNMKKRFETGYFSTTVNNVP